MQIFSRKDWGAKHGANWRRTMGTVDTVFLHTIAVPYYKTSLEDSFQHLRSIENYHVNSNGWSGIGYSWIIDTEGRIFEGRGLRVSGGHTAGHNSTAYGVAFFGNGDVQPATEKQIESFSALLQYLVEVQAITKNYHVRGHREVSTKSCPGNLIWPLVQNGTWSPSNVLRPAMPTQPKENPMIQHLYLEAFGRYGSPDEIAYWEGEYVKNPEEVLRLILRGEEAKQNEDDAKWVEKIAKLFNASDAVPDMERFLEMGLMTRAGIVDALLVSTISRRLAPPPVPGTVVHIDVDKASVLRIVSDALNDSMGG